MTPKQWLALFSFYISYLFFGASVFYLIEHKAEAENRAAEIQSRNDINAILTKYTAANDTQVQNEILRRVSNYCGKPVTKDSKIEPLKWSFYHAIFFSFTVCSTVGYGNISPTLLSSRIFMIFYALFGIPINGFLFAYLGDFFGKAFTNAYERYKSYKIATTKNYAPHQLGLIAQIILYLIPGMVVFLFLPSMIFRYFEEWDYWESLYYSFVTLSTIGFGDYVPTFISEQEEQFGFMFHVYQVFIIFWFIFGLGYLVMIMGFIAKGLRSKHLTRLEHQLADNIKATQTRIWNGVTKDVSYLRRILQEVYIMRFKSDYSDEGEPEDFNRERRSSSCPDLTIYRDSEPPPRKRAQSLFYGHDDNDTDLLHAEAIHRVQSDGDINRLDRLRPFDPRSPPAQPTELLARVFTALGTIKVVDDEVQSMTNTINGGVQGFSDSQILASEHKGNSRWSLFSSDNGLAVPPTRGRNRAVSDCIVPNPVLLQHSNNNEWTWNGTNAQIEEFMRARKLNKKKSEDLYRASFALPRTDMPYVVNIQDDISSPAAVSPATSPSLLQRLNPFKKSNDSRKMSLSPDRSEVQNYLNKTSVGRESRAVFGAGPIRRPSVFSILSNAEQSDANVLENTTIADLIRALEVVHTQAQTGAEAPLLQSLFEDPIRNNASNHTSTMQQSLNPLPMINIFPPSSPRPPGMRRNSMRPSTTSNTPIFDRISRRRQSAMFDWTSRRRSSILAPPSEQPPPYSNKANNNRQSHRRFSVRPTTLSIPPGQSPMPSIQLSSTLQRRLSTRPSPLLTDYCRSPGHYFGRSISTGSSTSPMQRSPILSRNRFLSPIDGIRPNVMHNRRQSLIAASRRKRCDSMQ